MKQSYFMNTHWHEWREAVKRTGYNSALKMASERMRILDSMRLEEVEELFAEVEKNTTR